MTDMKTSPSHLLSNLFVGFLVGGVLLTYQAMADNDGDPGTDSLPRVVPYSGVMEFNGQPHNGPLDVRFALFGDPEAGASDDCEADVACLWAEEWTSNTNNPDSDNPVMVYQGRFSVELGRTIPITDTIYDAGPLWLGMQVKAPGDHTWVSLAGRQRLNPVPYALWSASSANLDIAGNLNVGGDIQNSDGDITIRDDLNVVGDIQNSSGDVTIRDNLDVVGDIQNPDGDVVISDRLSINSSLTTTGDARFNGGNMYIDSIISSPNGRVTVLDTIFLNGGLDIYDRIVNPSGTNGGAVRISDDLAVTGNFYDPDGGAVNIEDSLHVSGSLRLENGFDWGGMPAETRTASVSDVITNAYMYASGSRADCSEGGVVTGVQLYKVDVGASDVVNLRVICRKP